MKIRFIIWGTSCQVSPVPPDETAALNGDQFDQVRQIERQNVEKNLYWYFDIDGYTLSYMSNRSQEAHTYKIQTKSENPNLGTRKYYLKGISEILSLDKHSWPCLRNTVKGEVIWSFGHKEQE